MSKVAATDILIVDDNGQAVILKAGKPVPAWAAKRINNVSALTDGSDSDPDASSPAPGSEQDQGDSGEPASAYADLKVAELRAELDKRGLDTDGKKAELVARLEAHDAAGGSEQGQGDSNSGEGGDDE